ncbi:MAG: exodeoxyribonuclease VII small subunit [Treponema sp.]|nr:exodeoxyribonuclease VII small subunit [Treponema sp.]
MKTFEDNLQRLEELTSAIKQSDISLEDALKTFEEGITLAKKMEKDIDEMEGKIQILMNAKDLDVENSSGDKKEKKASKKDSVEPALDLFTPSEEVTGTRNS